MEQLFGVLFRILAVAGVLTWIVWSNWGKRFHLAFLTFALVWSVGVGVFAYHVFETRRAANIPRPHLRRP